MGLVERAIIVTANRLVWEILKIEVDKSRRI